MTVTINQITNGMALLIDSDIFLVSEHQHVKPGKGSAFVRVKLKNLKNDGVLERTFRTADKLEDVQLEENELEFLYQSGDGFHFMDHATYEELVLTQAELGEVTKFLLENLEVSGLVHNHKVIKVVLPNFIEAQIISTEPGLRGDSTRSGTKPARIATGTIIQVPLFINNEDWVKIDTRSGGYVERVQK
jgi:elongation factor P